MPVYDYKAITKDGKKLAGLVEAETENLAKIKLRSAGHYPVNLKVSTKSNAPSQQFNLSQLLERVRPEEIHIFTRQLATLLDAGIPLLGALDAIAEQTENQGFKKVLFRIKESINEGQSFADSLSENPRLFSSIYVNMIRAGEASGTLDVVLERLADFGESQQALTGKLKAALVYPIFMGIIGTAILILLITYIVPNITQVFNDMDKALPTPTLLLLALSDTLISYWWALLIIAGCAIMCIKAALKQPWGRSWGDLFKLKVPIIGSVIQKVILARFAATLGSLLKSDVDLITSLQIVHALVNNCHIASVIQKTIEDVRKGNSMTKSLTGSPWFPPMLVQMIGVGEQSGSMGKMLDKAAGAYQREVETAVTAMTSLIEPIMIAGMGIAVGFVVLSILLPIFEMNQMIG